MLKIRHTNHPPKPLVFAASPRNDTNPQTPFTQYDYYCPRHSSITRGTPRENEQISYTSRPRIGHRRNLAERASCCFSEYVNNQTKCGNAKDQGEISGITPSNNKSLVLKKYIANIKGRNHVIVKEECDTVGNLDSSKARTNLVILCSPRANGAKKMRSPKEDEKKVCNRSASQESVQCLSPTHKVHPLPKSNIVRLSKVIESNYFKDKSQAQKETVRNEYYQVSHKPPTKNPVPRPRNLPVGITTDRPLAKPSNRKKPTLALPDDSNYNSMVSFMAGVKKIIEAGRSRVHQETQSNVDITQRVSVLSNNVPNDDATPKSNLLFTKTSALISTSATARDILATPRGGDIATPLQSEKAAAKNRQVFAGGKVLELKRPPEQPASQQVKKFRPGRRFRPMKGCGTATAEQIAEFVSASSTKCALQKIKETDAPSQPHHRCVASVDFLKTPKSPSVEDTPIEEKKELNINELKDKFNIQNDEQINLFPVLKAGLLSKISLAVSDAMFVVPLSITR